MKRLVFLLIFTVTSFGSVKANTGYMKLMRTPDASKDKLCFIYQDDLFTSNLDGTNPVRLVKAVGTEAFPRFSPNGKLIAFTSYFNGNLNVYTIPAEGGEVKQVTFESEGATMLEWSNDGKYIYFLARTQSFSPFFARIFKVSVNGGLPEVLPVDQASTLCFNDNGDSYVLNRHSMYFWWWKRYKGTANTDIWLYDGKTKRFKNLTKTDTNESWPIWVGNSIFYVSEDGGLGNLFKLDLLTNKKVKVTNFTKDNIQWPSLSSDRKNIVFECNGGIYKYDIYKNKTVEIKIKKTVQNVIPQYEFVRPSKLLTAYHISPTGKRVVFSARGEIFSAPAKNGEIRQLTFNSGARDEEPVWSPKGDKIAFISDMDGEENIYLIDQFAKTQPEKLTNRKEKFIEDLSWSPDGNYLSYKTNDFKLYVFSLKDKKEILVNDSKRYGQLDYSWSPDGNWLVYTTYGTNMLPQIKVYNLTTAKEYLIFKSFEQNYNPVFSNDGKYLYFVTSRQGDKSRIAMLSLTKTEEDPLFKEWDEEKVKVEKSNKEGQEIKKSGKKSAKKEKVTVNIDFEGIMDRVELLPVKGYKFVDILSGKDGLYIGFRKIAEKLANKSTAGFSFGFDLYYYKIKEDKLTEIANGIRGFVLSSDQKHLLLAKKGSFQIIPAGQKAGKKGIISLSNVEMKLDRKAEWRQIFNESWRMVRDQFYDKNIHGVNWKKMKKKYSCLIDYCETRNDVNRVLVQLVGELNASHQGARGGDIEKPDTVKIGALGAVLTPDKSGYYKFSKIYKGNPFYSRYKAPLSSPWKKVKNGDFLIAIDGNAVTTKTDYRKYLINKVGKTVFLTINNKPQKKGSWEVRVKPVSSEGSLRYLDWIEGNRKTVTEKSDGRIGYIHLNYMGTEQLNKFMNYIQGYYDKEGLILDVRFNGGGGIDPQLIDYLERKQYQVVRLRDSIDMPRPDSLFRGKVIVLCNEHSYSDAEVFPNAFKVRKLGKVVGVPTLGFVIAVNGYSLIDGGNIRKTFIGIWDINGNQLESRGAIPDIIVENNPNDLVKGIDAQLNKAIEVLLEEINESSVFPKVNTSIKER
jgi:tricorn protease